MTVISLVTVVSFSIDDPTVNCRCSSENCFWPASLVDAGDMRVLDRIACMRNLYAEFDFGKAHDTTPTTWDDCVVAIAAAVLEVERVCNDDDDAVTTVIWLGVIVVVVFVIVLVLVEVGRVFTFGVACLFAPVVVVVGLVLASRRRLYGVVDVAEHIFLTIDAGVIDDVVVVVLLLIDSSLVLCLIESNTIIIPFHSPFLSCFTPFHPLD